MLERNKKASAQRQPEASGDIQIVQHFNIADAGNLPRLKKNSGVWSRSLKSSSGARSKGCARTKARTAHASEKTTRQGQAWDQLAKDAYGDELRLGTLFPENVDELDVLIFGGDVRVAAPEAPSVAKVSSLPPWERM